MITEIKKLTEGKYLLNDSVVISDFDFAESGVSYKIDWDETLITEADATIMGDEFVHRAINNSPS